MDVLITGAHGTVGSAITDHLGEPAYDFTRMDIDADESADDEVVADVREYDSIRPHFTGQDAVVHLARSSGPTSTEGEIAWSDAFADNLREINNVYQAAMDADLDSIIFASSNHAVGQVEVRNAPDVYHDEGITVDHTEPHRPDSLYGVSKCYGEDLGRLVAESYGIQHYAIRIGSLRDPEHDHPYGDAEAGNFFGEAESYDDTVARMKGLWQSRRDFAHMIDCCLRDEDVEWDHFYGVSGNDRRWLDDLDHAREVIGYEPQDNGEEWDGPPE